MIYIDSYIHINMYTHINVYIYININIYTRICIYIYKYITEANQRVNERGGKESQEKVTELRDMLPTCTFYTGPSGIGKVEPTLPTKRDKKGQKDIGENKIQTNIGPVTRSRVRDH